MEPAAAPALDLQIARLQPLVDVAADNLLAAGREPTVRAVRERLGRGSPNVIAPALKRWRAALRERVAQGMVTPGLPPEVLEYVRLGYEAARVHAPAAQAPLPPTTPDTAVRRVIAALEGQVRSLRDERAQLLERCGRLEEELAVSRVVAQEFASAPRELQHLLDQAHETIGRLRAELVVAKAAVRTSRVARRTGSTARISNVGRSANRTLRKTTHATGAASSKGRTTPKPSTRRRSALSKAAIVRTPVGPKKQRATSRKRTRRKLN